VLKKLNFIIWRHLQEWGAEEKLDKIILIEAISAGNSELLASCRPEVVPLGCNKNQNDFSHFYPLIHLV